MHLYDSRSPYGAKRWEFRYGTAAVMAEFKRGNSAVPKNIRFGRPFVNIPAKLFLRLAGGAFPLYYCTSSRVSRAMTSSSLVKITIRRTPSSDMQVTSGLPAAPPIIPFSPAYFPRPPHSEPYIEKAQK